MGTIDGDAGGSSYYLQALVRLWFFVGSIQVILTDSRFYDPTEGKKADEVRGKLSMRESFSYLFRSRYHDRHCFNRCVLQSCD